MPVSYTQQHEELTETRRQAWDEQMPIKAIGRTLRMSRNTVRKVLRSGAEV